MCTAITYRQYFGRNLDLEYSYGEQVVVMPRNFPFAFRCGVTLEHHFALVGMATVADNVPLFYDATNERGLSMAGLDFPDNAYYPPTTEGETNIAPFELISWVLSQCDSVNAARSLLEKIHLSDIRFSKEFPQAPLHWILSDKEQSLVLEPMQDGLRIYENPVGVLTNNPPFPYHLSHLANYRHLSAGEESADFEHIPVQPYGGGLGAIGLPGDFSSGSRFVRAAFVKLHSHSDGTELGDVTQFFHILSGVSMPRGAIRVNGNKDEITRYSSCCNMDTGTYYYTTYENRRIEAIKMQNTDLLSENLSVFPLNPKQDILYRNERD